MVKTFHGRTNYRRLVRFLDFKNCIPKRYRYINQIMTIEPLVEIGYACYRLTYGNDTIDFYADIENSTIVPLRMENILEDINMTTFVTNTRIQKRYAMVRADERLYRMCLSRIFELGKEII